MGDVEGDNLQNLTLKYGSNPSITISNVPIKANTHVTLEGDIANAGPLQGTLTTTVDDAWETDKNAEISD